MDLVADKLAVLVCNSTPDSLVFDHWILHFVGIHFGRNRFDNHFDSCCKRVVVVVDTLADKKPGNQVGKKLDSQVDMQADKMLGKMVVLVLALVLVFEFALEVAVAVLAVVDMMKQVCNILVFDNFVELGFHFDNFVANSPVGMMMVGIPTDMPADIVVMFAELEHS